MGCQFEFPPPLAIVERQVIAGSTIEVVESLESVAMEWKCRVCEELAPRWRANPMEPLLRGIHTERLFSDLLKSTELFTNRSWQAVTEMKPRLQPIDGGRSSLIFRREAHRG